jgi:hypothetical protein
VGALLGCLRYIYVSTSIHDNARSAMQGGTQAGTRTGAEQSKTVGITRHFKSIRKSKRKTRRSGTGYTSSSEPSGLGNRPSILVRDSLFWPCCS